MKPSAFPITILVETTNVKGEPMVVHEVICLTTEQLYRKYQNIMSLYSIKDNHQIYFVCNSKVNSAIQKIKDIQTDDDS
jgi:hypothetical protein